MSDVIAANQAASLLTRSRFAAYIELTKPRITGMALVVTALGFYLALPADVGLIHLLLSAQTLLGTALVVAGANALNHYREADLDARMARTQNRPLPTGRLTGTEVLTFSLVITALGTGYLAMRVNLLAASLAAGAGVCYVFVYTPLKRTTSFSIPIGAVSGAIPPVIGWVAAAGSLGIGAALLFAIVFFWQLPHFAAIAWLYREDYGRAGYPMLPVIDPEGRRTSRHMITNMLALLVASLLPTIFGIAGMIYASGALALGLAFLAFGVRFAMRKTKEVARRTLLASVLYLPCLFALMVADRVPLA